MKYLFLVVAFVASTVFAEATFEQMQDLIAQKNYAAAEQGLETILKNHPDSAKAFYTMAQAQAGLGHLDKAQFALNKARGLDPSLKFASEDNVKALEQAITPQAAKIEAVEPSHFWRNLFLALVACGGVAGFVYMWSLRKKQVEEDKQGWPTTPNAQPASDIPKDTPPTPAPAVDSVAEPVVEKPKRGRKKKVVEPAPVPNTVQMAQVAPTPAPTQSVQSTYTPAPAQPTVINNYNDSHSSDMLTGVMIGSMMNNHHDHTTVIEREVIVERPSTHYSAPAPVYEAPSRSSSWDDTPATTKSSSWDDSSSSSNSSSWSSSSSSDSGSSWSSSDSSSSSDW